MSYLSTDFVDFGLRIAGSVVTATNQLKQARAEAMAAEYNADVAEAQSQAEKQKTLMEVQGIQQAAAYDQARLIREKKQTVGTQIARYASRGVRLEGSPIEVIADTAAQYEMDLAASRYNSRLSTQKLNYDLAYTQSRLRSEAEYNRIMAKEIEAMGKLSALGTIVSGGQTIYQAYAPKREVKGTLLTGDSSGKTYKTTQGGTTYNM